MNIDISAPNAKVIILVVHTEENWAIACECWQKIEEGSRELGVGKKEYSFSHPLNKHSLFRPRVILIIKNFFPYSLFFPSAFFNNYS